MKIMSIIAKVKIINSDRSILVMCKLPIVTIKATAVGKLLFDTGCGLTTFDREFVKSLGYDLTNCEEIEAVTANGVVQADIVYLDEFKVGGLIFRNKKIKVLNLDLANNVVGLLGMDIFANYNIFIDRDNEELVLHSTNYKCKTDIPVSEFTLHSGINETSKRIIEIENDSDTLKLIE